MKNLPKIVLVDDTIGKEGAALVAVAKSVKTASDPDAGTPPVTDTVRYHEADDVMDVVTKRKTDPSPTLTAKQSQLSAIVRRSYGKVMAYVAGVSNDVAVANGNIEAGRQVFLRCGFTQKKTPDLHPRGFEIVDQGPTWYHLRVKSVGKRAAYAWKCGISDDNNTPPTPDKLSPVMITLECDVIITNCKKGANYGFQFASILPATHTSETNTNLPEMAKQATLNTTNKAGKPTFALGQEPLQWSDFIFSQTT